MSPYESRHCPKCIGGNLIWEDGVVCLQCGWRPHVIPLGEWYARQERPTEQYWPAHGKTPPTRRYE